MQEPARSKEGDSPPRNIYDVNASDPQSELVDRPDMSADEIAQIGQVMKALSGLRDTERAVGEASARYMALSTQDMRALYYLIVGQVRASGVSALSIKQAA